MLLNRFFFLSVGPKHMIVCWEMSQYCSICIGVIYNMVYCLSMLSKHIGNDISHILEYVSFTFKQIDTLYSFTNDYFY